MSIEALMNWLLATDVSNFVVSYRWVWPICESLHFMGLVLMAGTVGVFDLRLLGLAKGMAPAPLHRLLRWGIAGFAISLVTGLMFISATPDQYFFNRAFHVKMICLTLVGINVVLFYSLEFAKVKTMGPGDEAPLAAKVMAAVSFALLIAVMCAGRMLTFFRPPPGVF
jgi:hypothetical protein